MLLDWGWLLAPASIASLVLMQLPSINKGPIARPLLVRR